MPSSSILAHPHRKSGHSAGRVSSPSSFIDGLSPHPSVNAHPFLSSTPPPLINGLERHPDAPKPIAMWDDATSYEQEGDSSPMDDAVDGLSSVQSSFFGKSRLSAKPSSIKSQSALPLSSSSQAQSAFSTPNLSPSASILSGWSGSGSYIEAPGKDYAEWSYDDPLEEGTEDVPVEVAEPDSTTAEAQVGLSPESSFSFASPVSVVAFSSWAGCTKRCVSHQITPPPRGVLSELLSSYLRRSAHA